MHIDDPMLTIYTPTFNRAHTLPRLYYSLLRQFDPFFFEWLVVDDGSTDGTKELINGYIREGKINIVYIYKKNGGKHTATNASIANACGRYWMCLDSDDYLANDAVQRIRQYVDLFSPEGIIAYKSIEGDAGISGDPFPDGLQYTTAYELANRFRCGGERTLIYRTDLIRNIKTPEPPGQKFFPENFLSDRFDEKYRSVLLPEVLCVCEYQDGGYSDSFRKLMYNNPVSMKWFYASRLDMAYTFRQRYFEAFHYVGYKVLAHSRLGEYSGKHKGTVLLSVPLGVVFAAFYHWCKIRERSHQK